jgi:hypothetical protein
VAVYFRVFRIEILSVMLVFSTRFVNCYPSPLLSGLNPPLPVCKVGGGGGGVMGF